VVGSTVIIEFAMSVEYTDLVVEGIWLLVPDDDLDVTVTPTVTVIRGYPDEHRIGVETTIIELSFETSNGYIDVVVIVTVINE